MLATRKGPKIYSLSKLRLGRYFAPIHFIRVQDRLDWSSWCVRFFIFYIVYIEIMFAPAIPGGLGL